MAFAELCITSNFTYLTGGSHPQEYAQRALELGLAAFAIADRNSVSGIVRAHQVMKFAQDGAIRTSLLPAARLCLSEGLEVTALPRDRAGGARLCRLLTLGAQRAVKGSCQLHLPDLVELTNLNLLLHPPAGAPPARWMGLARRFVCANGHAHLVLAPRYDGADTARFARIARLADTLGLSLVASGEPLMHHAGRRRLVDVLTCIRRRIPITELGVDALANAERRLRAEEEILQLCAGHEAAVHRAGLIAADCRFRLDDLQYEYPREVLGDEAPDTRLARMTRQGLARRYGGPAPDRITRQAERELALIARRVYAPYFLTVHDIVQFARGVGIWCQGRGSAANSVVCYALGITEVSPDQGTLVFERFISDARDEPPDIDVDFEHERREEVIQHIYDRYGRERAGLCATVIHYRAKRAIREVGAAMGISGDILSALASQVWGWSSRGLPRERITELGIDPDEPRLALTLELIDEVIGFPRHLSQHVGGFVITEGRLDELVPIENAAMPGRTVIAWDKDDIEALNILKVDVLALGMLTCLRKGFALLADHRGARHTLATIPADDPAVYDMLCKADSLGVFQVESRAQMSFLPRMQPRTFYDLVVEVAIVRPGPIQGDMVHPYLRRRRREEESTPPSDALGAVLGRTYGIPLFQEQAMQIAIIGAGFSPEEADRLRRALATFRRTGTVHGFRERFLAGMARNGYSADFAERCFSQIEGFGEYGFPESHAASFALLVYASAWLKRHHPEIFACALLNAQPMGFYAPAQIIRDARAHGVEVRPVCINASLWDNRLEPGPQGSLALRLGFRQVTGLKEQDMDGLIGLRGNGYRDVASVRRRTGLPHRVLERLVAADAFAALGLSRRAGLWQVRGLDQGPALPLLSDWSHTDPDGAAEALLPPMTLGEAVVADYQAIRMTLRCHPMTLLRPRLGATPRE